MWIEQPRKKLHWAANDFIFCDWMLWGESRGVTEGCGGCGVHEWPDRYLQLILRAGRRVLPSKARKIGTFQCWRWNKEAVFVSVNDTNQESTSFGNCDYFWMLKNAGDIGLDWDHKYETSPSLGLNAESLFQNHYKWTRFEGQILGEAICKKNQRSRKWPP